MLVLGSQSVQIILKDFYNLDDSGKDMCRSPASASLLKLCHLDLFSQDCVQIVFEYF